MKVFEVVVLGELYPAATGEAAARAFTSPVLAAMLAAQQCSVVV